MKNWKKELDQLIKDTLKARDSFKADVLRMLKTDLTNEEIKNNREELSEEQAMQVIQRAAKKRRESAEEFRKVNREDRALQEEKELEILSQFLPKQLSEQDIVKIVEEAVKEANPMGMKDFGKVMGLVMPKVKGQADGKLVNDIVKQKLSK